MTEMQPPPLASLPPLTPALALRDFVGVAKRNLLHSIRTPALLLYAVEPVMLLLLFRYILGGAIHVPGGAYVNFIVPSVFVLAVLVGAMTTAIGMAEDMKSGLIDRFRSLPMARSAVLTGRSLTDLVRSVVMLGIMVGLGVAVGFRFHSDAGHIVLGMVLVLVFGYAFSWLNAAIGIAVKDPESAVTAGMGPMFVLLFASNALVPVATLPGWLQAFARNQPLSVTVSAVRALLEGGGTTDDVWVSLAWSVGISVAFFLLAYRLYKRAASS